MKKKSNVIKIVAGIGILGAGIGGYFIYKSHQADVYSAGIRQGTDDFNNKKPFYPDTINTSAAYLEGYKKGYYEAAAKAENGVPLKT
jgi:hypothetical protein